MKLLFFVLVVFMGIYQVSVAQHKSSDIYLVKHYSTSSGLSNNAGYTITQDGKGFIWIGTDEGINRFDGINFQHFFRDNSGGRSVIWNRIFSLFTDNEGNVWVCSDAVSRYDIYSEKFTHWKYETGTPNSLINNRVNSAARDRSGNIWVATWEGVNKICGTTGKVSTLLPETSFFLTRNTVRYLLDNEYPTCVISGTVQLLGHPFGCEQTLADSLSALVADTTLAYSMDGILRHTDYARNDNSLIHYSVAHVNIDDRGMIWFAYHQHGISSYDPETGLYTHYTDVVDRQKSTGDLISYLAFSEDKVWIGTKQEGLKVLDIKTGITSSVKTDGEKYISHLRIDDHLLWIADNLGVLVFDMNTGEYQRIRLLHPDYGILPEMITRCTYKDNQGNVWIGTANKGVFLVETKKDFRYFDHHLISVWEDTETMVTCINQDIYNNFWIGYASGKVEIVSQDGELLSVIQSSSPNDDPFTLDIFAIFRDGHDNMWISSYEGGVKKFDSRGRLLKTYRNREGVFQNQILGNDVRSIDEDAEGNLYFGVHGKGISVLNPQTDKFKHLTHDPENPERSLSTDWIYQTWIEDDYLWISSVHGFSKYSIKNGTFIHYCFGRDEHSLSRAPTFTKDSRGLFWIGTEYGLVIFHPGIEEFIRITNENGLSSNLISSIVEDQNKNIWIGTPNGIDFIDLSSLPLQRDSLFILINQSLLSDRIGSFNEADGLISDNFSINTCYKTNKGWLYFGTAHGLVYFHPELIKTNEKVAPVYISGLNLFNKEVAIGDHTGILTQSIFSSEQITLKHHQNVITFKYASPSYTGAQKVQYAYKLEGFDEDWNYVGSSREATYTNLNSGTYRFMVKATNNYGVWSDNAAMLEVVVKPPFWKTNYAFVIYFLVIAGAVYLLITIMMIKTKARLDVEKMQEVDALKSKFFTNISHEIRTPLTLVAGPLKKIVQQKEAFNWQKNSHLVTLMYRNVVRLQYLVNQYLDFRKVENNNFNLKVCHSDCLAFLDEIRQAFDYVAEEKGIDLRLVSQHKTIDAWFDPEIIEKVTYNLLSNAIKFTPHGGAIEMNVELREPSGIIGRDNGSGRWIAVSIKDSGPGIPENLRKKVFERYFQVRTHRNINNRGTGIGLSLARELLEIHKGFIELKPVDPADYRQGSIFSYYIPIDEEHYKGNISDDRDAASLNKTMIELPFTYKKDIVPEEDLENENAEQKLPVVLIIEDHPELRHYLKHELSDHYHVFDADTAEEGFEIAIKEIPDLIVSDIMLPGMDGEELCCKIKSDIHTDHIPVILLTARYGESEKLSGLTSGADDYITKPFNLEELIIRIKNLIDSRKKIMEKFNHDFQIKPLSVIKMCADDKFLKKAIAIIEENISNYELDVDFMTDRMGVSRAQLYRKFNAVTKQTVKGFVKSVRMKKAAELLAGGELNVSEVAYSVGFSDLAYFTRCFKSAYQKTPSAYAAEYGIKEKS